MKENTPEKYYVCVYKKENHPCFAHYKSLSKNSLKTLKCHIYSRLTEAEDIKKRWQEYTEELYKKDLHNPDNHDGVITQPGQISWIVKSRGP